MTSKVEVINFFNEYASWYVNISRDHCAVPRTLSGIDQNGIQFTTLVEGIKLDHVARNNLIQVILEEEASVLYAYGTLTGVFNESTNEVDQELLIAVASDRYYVLGAFHVIRENGAVELKSKSIHEGDTPEKNPMTWLLVNKDDISEKDRCNYYEIWRLMRSEANFRRSSILN